MKRISNNKMASVVASGEINCEHAGIGFGLGTSFMTNPLTASAGLLILMMSTAALVVGDCDF